MPRDTPDESIIRRRLADAGQEHVLRFWKTLRPRSRRKLLGQLADIDFTQLAKLIDQHVTKGSRGRLPPNLEPANFIRLPRTAAERRRRRRMRDLGEELLAAGKVAALVVAGGHGTRLGSDEPKGTYPVGLVPGRPLFQILAEGILAARRACGPPLPWYIMTSETTDRKTRDFFRKNDFFGLPRRDVKFFMQSMAPAVDTRGKLLLSRRDKLAVSPDGHGGTLLALASTGMLSDMAMRGIEHISYFQVDNPLVPPLDPVFIGYHAAARSDMSSKMARKRDPLEKVGVFCKSGKRLHVIEYTDLPGKLAREKDGNTLRFAAGSIAIHILSRAFVERLTKGGHLDLPFHRAEKKVAYVDETGRTVTPREPNAIKFERFIFDALPKASNPVILEIDRTREFSPVKNAEAEDTPATARRDMLLAAAARLEEAGVRVPRRPDGEPRYWIRISPLAARTPEELKSLLARRGITELTHDLYLDP